MRVLIEPILVLYETLNRFKKFKIVRDMSGLHL